MAELRAGAGFTRRDPPDEQPASTATNTAPVAARNARADTVVPQLSVVRRDIPISSVPPPRRWMAPVFGVVLADRNKDYMSRTKVKRNYVYFSSHLILNGQKPTRNQIQGCAENEKTRATAQNLVL